MVGVGGGGAAEIAHRMGIAAATVMKHLTRAWQRRGGAAPGAENRVVRADFAALSIVFDILLTGS